jgi:hypothetical protein
LVYAKNVNQNNEQNFFNIRLDFKHS